MCSARCFAPSSALTSGNTRRSNADGVKNVGSSSAAVYGMIWNNPTAPTGERAAGLKCDSCRARPIIKSGSTLCRVAAADTSAQYARGYASAQKSAGRFIAGCCRNGPKYDDINVEADV